MNLYFSHLGFYPEDSEIKIECHDFAFVVAETTEQAKAKIKDLPKYKKLRMHIDSLTWIDTVEGYKVSLKENTN